MLLQYHLNTPSTTLNNPFTRPKISRQHPNYPHKHPINTPYAIERAHFEVNSGRV